MVFHDQIISVCSYNNKYKKLKLQLEERQLHCTLIVISCFPAHFGGSHLYTWNPPTSRCNKSDYGKLQGISKQSPIQGYNLTVCYDANCLHSELHHEGIQDN